MDDSGFDKNQVKQKIFQNGRHGKCACIYLTHQFHHNQPELNPIRRNTAIVVLFEQLKMVLQQITRDINLGMDIQEFYQLARKVWAKPKENKYLNIYSLIQKYKKR